jgi:hypothetical protein
MIKRFRQWMWTRRMKRATEREQVLKMRLDAVQQRLEGQLRGARQEAETWKGHYKRLDADFRALFDDNLILRQRLTDIQAERLEWVAGPAAEVEPESEAVVVRPRVWGRQVRVAGQ